MMPAAKHLDPVMGVDIHIILIPTPAGPVPTPLPHPFVGMIMDPFDYAPIASGTFGSALARCRLSRWFRAQFLIGEVQCPQNVSIVAARMAFD